MSRPPGRVPLQLRSNIKFDESEAKYPSMLNESAHPRDGSLLKKKQEQWAREREEESQLHWFPFGSPGGGAPNRRSTRSPAVREVKETVQGQENLPSTSANHHPSEPAQTVRTSEILSATSAMSNGINGTNANGYNSTMNGKLNGLPNGQGYHPNPSQAPIPIAVPIAFPPGYVPTTQLGSQANGAIPSSTPFYPWPPHYAPQPYAYPYSYIPPPLHQTTGQSNQTQTPHNGFTSIAECPLTRLEQAGYGWSCSGGAAHCQRQCSNEPEHRVDEGELIEHTRVTETDEEHTEICHEKEFHRGRRVEMPLEQNAHLISSSQSTSGIPSDPSSRVTTGRTPPLYTTATSTTPTRYGSSSVTSHEPNGSFGGSSAINTPNSANSSNSGRRQQIPTSILDEQVAEKRRLEREAAERERLEEERARREEAELERRREVEEKRLRDKMREKEEHLRSIAEAEEKKHQLAREAELFKKAKLFRHVLLDGERNPDMELKLLGVTGQDAEKILDQVRQFERQQKLKQDEIVVNAKSRKSEASQKPAPLAKSHSLSVGSSSGGEERQIYSPTHSGNNPQRERPIFTQNCQPPVQFQRRQPGRISVRETKKEKLEAEKENGTSGFTRRSALPVLRNSPLPVIKPHSQPQAHKSRQPYDYQQQQSTYTAQPQELDEQLNRTLTIRTDTIDLNHNEHHHKDCTYDATSPASTATKSPSSPRGEMRNTVASSALFAPISTRNRRNLAGADSLLHHHHPQLQAEGIGVGTQNTGAGIEERKQERRGMRGFDSPIGTESSASSEEALPPHTIAKHSFSPAPSIRVEEESSNEASEASNVQHFETPRIRSRLGHPGYYLNGTNTNGRTSPLEKTVYYKKLVEKGVGQHEEDVLSPAIRRKAEASLSRTPSIASLYGSMRDLRGSNMNLSAAGKEDDPNLGRFKSMSPAYRSFNSKRTLDRQNEVIEKLAKLRDQLRSKENFMERGHMGQLKTTSRPASNNNLSAAAQLRKISQP